MSMSMVQSFFCNYLGYFCPKPSERISADGVKINNGDKVLVYSKSLIAGATAAADILTATPQACPDKAQIRFENANGNVCLNPSSVYVDISAGLQAITSGKAHILPYPISIHESD